MGLFLGQTLSATQVTPRRFRLATMAYTYSLTPSGGPEPVLRWEYVRHWPDPHARWCRHHLQGDIRVPLGVEEVTLNDVHAPTGYVTVEEIIRFCLSDLGVSPLAPD
jgi:hypothetical protein